MKDTKIKKPFYKKWWVWIIVIMIIGGIKTATENDNKSKKIAKEASSTNQPTSTEQKKQNNTDIINLNLDVKLNNNNGKPFVIIQANFPDGMEGMISLENNKANYRGNDSIVFKNGACKSQTFSNGNSPLPTGEYILTFTTPIYNVQPDVVKSKIGENYSKVRSKYIEKSELGNTISYIKNISIKGNTKTDKDIEKNDDNVKVQAKSLLQELNSKYNNGKQSDAEWAKFVREFMPKIDNLESKTEKFILKVTLGDIKQLLFEYRKDLEGRGDKARIKTLKNDINKNLK